MGTNEMSKKEIRPIDANAAIEALSANFQHSSQDGCEHPLYQIAEDTIAEMPTIYAAPSGDQLTLEQLREMVGRPVWVQTPGIPQYGRWVIVAGVDIEDKTLYCRGDYTCRDYGKTWLAYAFHPASIDLEEWESEWKEYTGADAGFHYCSKCKLQAFNYEECGEVIEVLSDFCPGCARAMNQKARDILENRLSR